jgi:hypothetical protein
VADTASSNSDRRFSEKVAEGGGYPAKCRDRQPGLSAQTATIYLTPDRDGHNLAGALCTGDSDQQGGAISNP